MRYILIALFLWSSSFVAGKYTYTMLDPVLMVQLRLLIATIIVLPMFMRVWKRIPKGVVVGIIKLSGDLSIAIYWFKPHFGIQCFNDVRVRALLGGADRAFFLWRQSPNSSLDLWFSGVSWGRLVNLWR